MTFPPLLTERQVTRSLRNLQAAWKTGGAATLHILAKHPRFGGKWAVGIHFPDEAVLLETDPESVPAVGVPWDAVAAARRLLSKAREGVLVARRERHLLQQGATTVLRMAGLRITRERRRR